MSVSKLVSTATFYGNGSATEFNLPFYVGDSDSVALYKVVDGVLEEVTSGTSHSAGVGVENTTLTFTTAPEDGVEYYAQRVTPISQLVSLRGQVSYNPTVVEGIWDKLTRVAQELSAGAGNVLRATFPLPPVKISAGQTLIANTDGTAIVAGPTADAIAAAQEWGLRAEAAAAAAQTFDPANYQPKDATLTSLSALGTAANRIAVTTGVDTWAETVLTAAGRALLDDADAQAQRATLQLGDYLATLPVTADWNAVMKSGVTVGQPTAANTPTAGWMIGRTDIIDANNAMQVLWQWNSSGAWRRWRTNAGWSAWVPLYSSVDEIKTGVLNASGSAPVSACRAWVCFDGYTATIRGAMNVSFVTRDSAGDWWITFQTPMPHANYCVVGASREASGAGGRSVMVSEWNVPLTTSVRVINRQGNVTVNSDSDYIFVAIFC